MKLQQVSESCFAVLNEKNLLCDANSGLINLGGGVVVDTQSDLPHGRRMIELFGKVWRGMPRRVVNTHEDGDHVWGNQLFEGAEIIAHRTVRELMPQVADPKETQQLIEESDRFLSRLRLSALHPGALALARQLKQDHDFEGIRLVLLVYVMKLTRFSQGRSSAWAPSRTAPAWTTTISPTRAPRSRSASNGWAGCAAASPNRRASRRPAAGRSGLGVGGSGGRTGQEAVEPDRRADQRADPVQPRRLRWAERRCHGQQRGH